MREVKIGEIYKHFKGNIYKIVNIGLNSEDLTKMVVYEDINTHKIWIRNYDMFIEEVDKNKYPNVLQKYRFEKIENDN